MVLDFVYAGKHIEFEVIFSRRKTMEISITPDCHIKVRSPIGVKKEIIIEQVKIKAPWILKKLYQFRHTRYKPLDRQFVSGETFMYLGKEYFLYIDMQLCLRKPEIRLIDDKIILTVNDKSDIRKVMELWYRERAKEKITERIHYYQEFFNKSPLEIKVKDQKKRWGSCTYEDVLLFNWRCIMLPLNILDYVVVHEMCHMVHKNHSKEYWALVASILNNYKERHRWLKENGFKISF